MIPFCSKDQLSFRIAFGNKSRVGKDEACSYLQHKYDAKQVRFASALYDCQNYILERLNLPKTKDPRLLQLLGEGLRNLYGRDIWLNQVVNYINTLPSRECIVVPDLRHKNEADALKKLGFTLVKITRKNRPIDRDPNHISEIDLDEYPFDYKIENDGTLEEFYDKVETLLLIIIHRRLISKKWEEILRQTESGMPMYMDTIDKKYNQQNIEADDRTQ
jgi:hypothetical protein